MDFELVAIKLQIPYPNCYSAFIRKSFLLTMYSNALGIVFSAASLAQTADYFI